MDKNLSELQRLVTEFRDERDWKQFHKPKECITALFCEVAELAELLLWKNDEQTQDLLNREQKGDVADELADIFFMVLLLGHDLKIDLAQALANKIEKNRAKYPVDKFRGRAEKYNQLVKV